MLSSTVVVAYGNISMCDGFVSVTGVRRSLIMFFLFNFFKILVLYSLLKEF